MNKGQHHAYFRQYDRVIESSDPTQYGKATEKQKQQGLVRRKIEALQEQRRLEHTLNLL